MSKKKPTTHKMPLKEQRAWYDETEPKSPKWAQHALRIAVRKMHDGTEDTRVVERIQPLVDIWYRAMDEARNGNMQATSIIMDRLDGKPSQEMDVVADIRNRTVEELSEEELLSIAQNGLRASRSAPDFT